MLRRSIVKAVQTHARRSHSSNALSFARKTTSSSSSGGNYLLLGAFAGFVQLKLAHDSYAQCERAQLAPPEAPKIAAIVAKKTDSMVEQARELLSSMLQFMRYLARILTFAMYGAPLTALLPVAWFLGKNIESKESME
jgi:hypothetical protein